MNSTVVAVVLALAGLGVFWPSVAGGLSKLKGMFRPKLPSIGGGDSISRDEAVAGLVRAIDYAHQEGRHDVCDGLGAFLPGLVRHAETKHA